MERMRWGGKMAETKGNENLMAAASYLLGFVTGIIFLLIEKQSRFVRFHAMQSTILFGGIFVVNLALGFIPILGWLLNIVVFVAVIVGIIKALQGERWELPLLGSMAKHFGDWLIKALKL